MGRVPVRIEVWEGRVRGTCAIALKKRTPSFAKRFIFGVVVLFPP